MSFSSRNKGKSKGSAKGGGSGSGGGSPLDSRQRELLEEQSKLQEQIDALQRTISQGPAKTARPRPAASTPAPRRAGPPVYRSSAVLADKRYDEEEAPLRRNKPKRRLKAEVRQAQMQMLALLVVLVAAVLLAIHWLM